MGKAFNLDQWNWKLNFSAGENQEINFDMDMNMDPAQYEIEYGKLQGFAGAGMASSYYRWPKAIIPYK